MLGISVDSVASHKAWAESIGGVHFPLLSDFFPHGQVAERYGVLITDPASPAYGATERALIIIDKDGIIRWIDVHPIDQKPELDELFAVLEEM